MLIWPISQPPKPKPSILPDSIFLEKCILEIE